MYVCIYACMYVHIFLFIHVYTYIDTYRPSYRCTAADRIAGDFTGAARLDAAAKVRSPRVLRRSLCKA